MDGNDTPLNTNPVALITGASSGLGALFARELARRGYDLLLVARRKDRLEALAVEIQSQQPVAVEVFQTDLSNAEQLNRLEAHLSQLDRLEFLVNNAGFATYGRFARVEPDKHIAMVNVHLVATVRLTRAALPGMLSRQKGAIINVSSMSAFVPIGVGVVYGTTKAALVAFSQALSHELRGSGVRVQALCPGFIRTEFHETPELKKFQRSSVPGFMWGNPETVVSDSFRALEKGQVVCIPGGFYKFGSFFLRNQIFSPIIKLFIRWFYRRR